MTTAIARATSCIGWLSAAALFGALAACTPSQDEAAETDAPAQVETGGEADFAHQTSDLPVDPAVRYGRLDNGMRYAILQNDTPSNTAVLRMAFNAGSLNEADDQRGLAHFLEHMAFNGSENVPEGEMIRLLERYGLEFGPDTNAGTNREYVIYMLNLPDTNDELVDTGLMIMRETASNLTLDADAIDRERNVILSEERFRNTPIRRWNNALTEFRYPGALVVDRDAIGIPEVIETAPRERFVDYYENFYTPERAMFVVVGDIDPDQIEALIETHFGDWEQPEDPREDPVPGEVVADRGFETGYFHDPEIFTIMTIDAIRPGEREADTAATRFDNGLHALGNAILERRLDSIINSGTSPLIQANVGYSQGEYDFATRAGILGVSQPERWTEALAILEQELRRAREFGFTQGELNEQISNMRTALQNAAAQAATRENSDLAGGIWSSWRYGNVFGTPAAALERFNSRVDEMTLEAVDAAFREQWDGVEPQVFLATSLQIDNAEAAIAAAWDDSVGTPVEAMEDAGAGEFAYTDFGTPGDIAQRAEIEGLGLTRVVFENGVRVTLKPTDFEDDVIRVSVRFGRGELEPRENGEVVDTIASAIFQSSGLGQHSADELQRVLAGRSVGGGFAVGEDSFYLGGSTTPADFQLQMQLMAAYLTDPGWRPEGLAQYRAVAPEIRRNLRSSPSGMLQLAVSRLLRSGDNRYGYPTPEEVAAVEIDEARAFLAPALERSPIEITVVGDIDIDAALDAIASTFGALPERDGSWPDFDENRTATFPAATTEPVILRHNGQDYQSMVNVYWPTIDDSDTHRSRVIRMLRQVFDLKLTERLREAEGFTYSAFNSNYESVAYPGFGYLWVGVDIRPENADAVYNAIEELAADLRNGEIDDDEMQRARQPLLEQIEDAMESNGTWLGWLDGSFDDPSRLENIRSITEDYRSITRDEIIEAARTWLDPEAEFRVTILPNEAQ